MYLARPLARSSSWLGRTALVPVILAALVPATSVAGGLRLHGVFAFGGDFGGTDLVTLTYADGTRSTLSSAGGLRIAAGALFSPLLIDGHSVEIEVTAGAKGWNTPRKADGSVDMVRWPVEALLFYRYEPFFFRVGGGLAYHLAPTLTASGAATSLLGFSSISFAPALGYVVQAEFASAKVAGFTLGVRYTFLDYVSGNGTRVPSSGLGIVASISYGLDFARPPATPAMKAPVESGVPVTPPAP